jgi:alkaline phosphatase D
MTTAGSLSRRSFLAGGAAAAGLLVAGCASGSSTAPGLRDPFMLGVASGDPDHQSVVLWTRLAPEPLTPGFGMPTRPFEVSWEIAEDERMSQVVQRGTETATPELGHSVHAEPVGLRPGREYWYRFRTGDHISEIGRTRTLPEPASSPDGARFAVACCQHFQTGYYTAYRSLADARPDFVLFLGDYVYEYPPDDRGRGSYLPERLHIGPPELTDLDGYRIRWSQYKADPDLRNAHAGAPFVTVWDDHEVLNDYAGLVPQPAGVPGFARRRAHAYQVFYENLPVRRRGQFTDLRIYHRFRLGDLATVNMLDTRQYRDDQPCDDGTRFGNLQVDETCGERDAPNRSMLGTAQRDWLIDGLRGSRTRWNLVAQQALFSPLDQNLDPAHGEWEIDAWDGYTAERRTILDAVSQTRVPNAVVLSGDIHSHLVADLQPEPREGSPVVATELVAGAISSPSFDDLTGLMPANPHLRYTSQSNGYLWIDLDRTALTSEIHGMRNPAGSTRVTPDSRPVVEARHVVENGRPGAQPV